jgi:hypothetical protein
MQKISGSRVKSATLDGPMTKISSLLFSSLLVSCILVDDDDGTEGTTTGDDTGTPTTSATNNSNAVDTGMSMNCMYHCFTSQGFNFPYSATPLDEDGNPNNVPLACEGQNGSTISLTGVDDFLQDLSVCAPTQAMAQEIQDLAICDSGAIPQPPSDDWESWARLYSHRLQRQCVTLLYDTYGCDASPPGEVGAENICFYYVEYPLYYDLLESTPDFEEVAEEMGEATECTFNDLMECGGGSGGGGVLPFGEVSQLVSCNQQYTSCTFDSELEELLLLNTNRIYVDGVRFTALKLGQTGYPGMKITLPNYTPDTASEKLFFAFGFHDGDVIRTANGINLTSRETLEQAFYTLFDTGTTTARVYRNGQLLRVQAFEAVN